MTSTSIPANLQSTYHHPPPPIPPSFPPPTLLLTPMSISSHLPSISTTCTPTITQSISTTTPHQISTATSRNAHRLASEHSSNAQLIGTSIQFQHPAPTPLPHSISSFLPHPTYIEDPSPHFDFPLMTIIDQILAHPCPVPAPPPFVFATSTAAADHNLSILQQFDFNVDKCLHSSTTTCTPGTEFRAVHQLDNLFSRHELWSHVRPMLLLGASTHLSHDPDPEQRSQENTALLSFNNHKTAQAFPAVISKSLNAEVRYGFCVVLPLRAIPLIPHSMICPLGIAEQMTIAANGDRIPKQRLTHDQTFCLLTGSESVNLLTDKSQYAELIFGFCLHRMIYQAISLRHHFPTHRILCAKYDFAKAYRRLHYDGKSASRCIAVFQDLAYMMLRLSFGGTSCPASWCSMSEIITDLANELLHDPLWSGNHPHRSPDQALVPPPTRLCDSIPLAPSLPTMVLPPPRPVGMTDVFVDDVSTLFLDTDENCWRAPAAVPLAIHIISRPMSATEPLPRDNVLSTDKLTAEGSPSEIKTILGWSLDFHRLQIHLPSDKHISWTTDLQRIIHTHTCTKQELDQLIGRLNHAATILPLARFFLGRLRTKNTIAFHRRTTIHFNKSDLKILRLWVSLLDKAHTGISFNMITLRVPTNILITDACPKGIGGFSVSTGKAWRLDISRFSHVPNNSLEFLASVVGVLFEHHHQHIPSLGNILALTDNSSCACWLWRSNFDQTHHPVNFEISTTLAHTCLEHDFTIHSQHIRGSHNILADILSRRHDLNDLDLTKFVTTTFPSQVPQHMTLCPLPAEITQWVFSTLALHQSSLSAAPKPRMKRPTDAGDVGCNSFNESASPTILSSTPSLLPSAKPPFAAPSSLPSNEGTSPAPTVDIAAEIRKNYSAGVSVKPSATWLRNSRTISGQARFTSMSVPTSSNLPSVSSFVHGPTRIHLPKDLAPSPHAIFDSFTNMASPKNPFTPKSLLI